MNLITAAKSKKDYEAKVCLLGKLKPLANPARIVLAVDPQHS